MTGKISVYSILILSLFDSSASYYFISRRFTTLYSIPLVCMSGQWKISMGNEVITTNRICKACTIELRGKKLEAYMLVLDTEGTR